MTCVECEKLLMQYEPLTSTEKERLLMHTTSCRACAQALELIELEQHWVNKVEPASTAHAAALTHKIMQSLPPQKVSFSFGFLNVARIGFATGSLALFFWLGSELLIEKTFRRPASAGGPVLNSSEYITHPLERKTKTISLTERIKNKGL